MIYYDVNANYNFYSLRSVFTSGGIQGESAPNHYNGGKVKSRHKISVVSDPLSHAAFWENANHTVPRGGGTVTAGAMSIPIGNLSSLSFEEQLQVWRTKS